MKKLLFLLLAPMIIGGMHSSCKDENKETTGNDNTNAKWVIEKTDEKSDNGKLFVTLPEGTTCDVTIYAAGSDTIVSNTMMQQNFPLPPGSYDLQINHVKVTGVPVEKGNNTRLKAGVLRISKVTSWTLYDVLKENVLINSLTSGSWGLPVGKYVLTMLEEDRSIEIRDGKTVKY
jgi:hypothetical protein